MYLGMKFIFVATMKSFRDILRIMTFRAPYNVPIVAEPDEFACMNTPGSKSGYLRLVPKNSRWKNECPARALLLTTMYWPIASAQKLKCPALFVMAKDDSLIPAKIVKKTADRVPNSELISLSCGHFDVYSGRLFDEVSLAEADFLERELKS
jgi:pimeloyl-ACP methyl ester carboxylesterase